MRYTHDEKQATEGIVKDFKRARSEEQKNQRMADIKQATAELFATSPYHEITLTTIAARLGWSRANLYKYVTTKEEIFLELTADARDTYFDALVAVFDTNVTSAQPDIEKLAKDWARVAAQNQAWFSYGALLLTIIETNVTVERLKVFKKDYYDALPRLTGAFSQIIDVDQAQFSRLLVTIGNQAIGLVNNCAHNPLIAQALEELGIERAVPDFEPELADFIEMCLDRLIAKGM